MSETGKQGPVELTAAELEAVAGGAPPAYPGKTANPTGLFTSGHNGVETAELPANASSQLIAAAIAAVNGGIPLQVPCVR